MYRNLFTAWYFLGVLALFLGSFFILLPFIGMDRATGCTGFLGLIGLSPLFHSIFRKEKQDERDISFLQRSVFFGFACGIGTLCVVNTWVFFFYWGISGDNSVLSIPAHVFWAPTQSGLCVGILAFSVLLLLFYYKGENADKGGQTDE